MCLPRTHPTHSNLSKNQGLVLFELFHSGQKHRTRVGLYWSSWTKDRHANHEVCFCHERTQYTPICPKIMFWCFLNFFIPVKNISHVWDNIGINGQKFDTRITKYVFATNAPNTLRYVQKSWFGAF